MENKQPKITVTDYNREYVIPTLEKLGGSMYMWGIEPIIGYIWFINEGKKIDSQLAKYFIEQENESDYYEVPESEYVRPNESIKGLDLEKMKSELHERLNNETPESLNQFLEKQRLKEENSELREENNKLRELGNKLFELYQIDNPNFPCNVKELEFEDKVKQLLNK